MALTKLLIEDPVRTGFKMGWLQPFTTGRPSHCGGSAEGQNMACLIQKEHNYLVSLVGPPCGYRELDAESCLRKGLLRPLRGSAGGPPDCKVIRQFEGSSPMLATGTGSLPQSSVE